MRQRIIWSLLKRQYPKLNVHPIISHRQRAELTITLCAGRGKEKGRSTTGTEGRVALGLNYPVSGDR